MCAYKVWFSCRERKLAASGPVGCQATSSVFAISRSAMRRNTARLSSITVGSSGGSSFSTRRRVE